MINRTLVKNIQNKLFKGKTIVIVGARQVGKTTLIKTVLSGKDYLFLNGDDPYTRSILRNPSTKELENIIGNSKIVFIDEAQRLENIGITAKIIHDQMQNVQLILSGSSAFELKNKTNEALTGRKFEYFLMPISYEELEQSTSFIDAASNLKNRLVFGMYPEIINHPGEEVVLLNELTQSYLYKDILALGSVQKPDVLEKILRALAFQVGSEVSYNEVAQLVGVDKNTVANYIHLLELSYVIFTLPSLSRNLRNEIKTNKKIYFYDNGVRNALIQNFNPLELRNDVGALWENFLITERMKRNSYHQSFVNRYFWRTVQQQEIDYVEEQNGVIKGYEFKWNPKAKAKQPKAFIEAYQSSIETIHQENYRDFIVYPPSSK